ncbi:hypothetical protein AB4391_24060 [Vibrio lentus]|uniref:Chromosome partitioning protein ParA n=1 Tax=Vibrio lentus TaxID=136468 RepID=A0A2N7KF06_9VIBR|nr:hypothetical protein [Vibrio lentus]PMM74295.1 hypothetical protein BCT49_24210 [Vibrio lentus]
MPKIRVFYLLSLIIYFSLLSISAHAHIVGSQTRAELIVVPEVETKANKMNLVVHNNEDKVLYSEVNTRLYELIKKIEKMDALGATKEELRVYHSKVLLYERDLQYIDKNVTDRVNDLYQMLGFIFTTFSILLVISGYIAWRTNKTVARDEAREWCRKELGKETKSEREVFAKELDEMKASALSTAKGFKESLENEYASYKKSIARHEMQNSASSAHESANVTFSEDDKSGNKKKTSRLKELSAGLESDLENAVSSKQEQ